MSILYNINNLTRKIIKYGPYIPLSNLLMLYGGKWLGPSTLQNLCDRRNAMIQARLRPLIDRVSRMDIDVPSPKVCRDNAIWFCWFQGEAALPPVPQMCLSYLRRYANGHEVIVLDKDNFTDYVTLPDGILSQYRTGRLKQAHFADLLRISLLAQQGGLWLDATMLLTAPIPSSVFDADFFSIKTEPEGYFVSRCRWAVFALACHRGNRLFAKLARLFEHYLSSTDVFIDYFMFDQFINLLAAEDPEIARMIDDLPFNNPEVHSLNNLLEKRAADVDLKKLTAATYLFKLSWRGHNDGALMSPDSLFTYLAQA